MNKYEYKDEKGEHLHILNGKPLFGTSTITGVISKELTWWASGLAVAKFGWINSKKRENGKYITIDEKTRLEAILPRLSDIKDMDEVEFLALCDEAYNAHAKVLKESASAGTSLHAELELYVKECLKSGGKPKGALNDKIQDFVNWSLENVKEFIWSEANCYSESLWCGGISDCGAILKDGKKVIIDFKSAKEAYQSHFIQIAGYALQIEENGIFTPSGEKIKDIGKIDGYIVVPFGSPKFYVEYRWNVEELKEGFKSALVLYKLTKLN